ncbi:MAG: NIPSNAP family containing protein [Candidatus Omnitrophota bacterium]|jgi:hypothetical protein|nr:MAG: NIPSNAP family containing protein [Candidatus Omnitrophota bacterium]
MDRRNFVATSSLLTAAAVSHMAVGNEMTTRQYLELRKYTMLVGEKKNGLHDFLRDAAIPAVNRLGVKPVGVFTVLFGENAPTLYVLIPHPSLESVATMSSRLAADEEFLSAGASFNNAPLSDPVYVRMENSLMVAFREMPKVETPDAIAGKKSRIFELRIYESHSKKAAIKKIEMFNEGGEIQIFRDTGLHPVFFGESLIGPRLPNLTYMLGFENMDERYKNWDQFRVSPAWKQLSGDPQYKDTVSNITDVILRPTDYSQI